MQYICQFMVDYYFGRVKIFDDGILSSGTPIKKDLESNSLLSVFMIDSLIIV